MLRGEGVQFQFECFGDVLVVGMPDLVGLVKDDRSVDCILTTFVMYEFIL